MSYTLLFVIITVAVSLLAFSNDEVYNKLILWPRVMHDPLEYHRFLSSGFIHADYGHLFFNMFSLFFIGKGTFGDGVEDMFVLMGRGVTYPVLYLSGIVAASIPSYIKHRNDSYYRSLGASGGVSAVIFALVYLNPWRGITVYFISMPTLIFAVLYIGYCIYASKRGADNINHDAHLWGAVYGLVFTLAVDPTHGQLFLQQILHPQF